MSFLKKELIKQGLIYKDILHDISVKKVADFYKGNIQGFFPKIFGLNAA